MMKFKTLTSESVADFICTIRFDFEHSCSHVYLNPSGAFD